MIFRRRKGPLRRLFFEEEEKKEKSSPLEGGKSTTKPESGKTFAGQSNEAYCLECVEGHTMKGATEIQHAIDRYRTANEMTPGVVEKVREAIGQVQGIVADVKNLKDADAEVKKGLEEILDEVRWIRKDYGISGRGLTRGYGTMEDLEELRSRIQKMQLKAYALVEKCPTCKVISRKVAEQIS